jgi:hypothetical protein
VSLLNLNTAICAALGLLVALPFQSGQTYLIGTIEFFGHKGIDVAALRGALPIHEGDEYDEAAMKPVRQVIRSTINKEPTDVNVTCCDNDRRLLVYIGLPGTSYRPFAFNTPPGGNARLSAPIVDLEARLDKAIEAAVRKGGEGVQEDDSRGYALVKDPAARALQLSVRRYAVAHDEELLRTLASAGDVEQRRMASEALGYARQSRRQVDALIHAARDPDDEVRNNATRALGVLAKSRTVVARAIPPATFIEMVSAGAWTDRNKGAMLLEQLTASRDPALLNNLRANALDSLVEMAEWRESGHAYFARMIVGRIAGIPEVRLEQLASDGPVGTIIDALHAR